MCRPSDGKAKHHVLPQQHHDSPGSAEGADVCKPCSISTTTPLDTLKSLTRHTCLMVALALVRDMARPAPWLQLFQLRGSPFPMVMKLPTPMDPAQMAGGL